MRSGPRQEADESRAAPADGRARACFPAVDYLQSQRIRMMMMMKLAEATAHVDVYLGPGNGGGARAAAAAVRRCGGAGGAAARAERGPRRRRRRRDVRAPGQRHSAMANLATYPAVAVPNGFNAAGRADEHHVLRAAVRRVGAAGGGEGVSGRDRVPPEASGARPAAHLTATGQPVSPFTSEPQNLGTSNPGAAEPGTPEPRHRGCGARDRSRREAVGQIDRVE